MIENHRVGGRRVRGDEGVSVILLALIVLGIMVIAALVIDLGNVRNSRQDNKLIADVTSTAGLQSLAPDGVPKPWRAACAALAYLEANQSDVEFDIEYLDGNETVVAGNPCETGLNQECVAANPITELSRASWAWIRATDDDYVVDIRTGYVTPDPAFSEDTSVYDGDNGVPEQGGCDQLAVIIGNQDDAIFGGAAGATDYSTASRSVGRVRIDLQGDGVPAFLMLERTRCDTLSEIIGTGGGQGIIVDPATTIDPGIIHVDSSGSSATGCNGNNNPGGWAVFSSGVGGSPGSPGIVANPSASGVPGVISIRALQVGSPPTNYGGAQIPPAVGISPAPVGGRLVSRQPVDDKYNSAGEPTISEVHADGFADAIRTSPPPASQGALGEPVPGSWTSVGCSANGNVTGTKIFVNCSGGFSPNNAVFVEATDVIFNGPVRVAGSGPSGRSLFMPAARRVVVGGDDTRGLEVDNNGRLGVNSQTPFVNTDPGASGACAGREGPAWGQTTKLVIFGGPDTGGGGALSVTGRAALCQTFVYLAGPTGSGYSRQADTSGTDDSTCTPTKPCALSGGANTATDANFVVSGYLRWSAPNQLTDQPAPGFVGVEDLALWTESDEMNEVRAGGILEAFGVYFMPNARAEMRSPALATPRDAQFIARSLQLLQGTLRMQPTPGNAVQVPVLGGIGLVR